MCNEEKFGLSHSADSTDRVADYKPDSEAISQNLTGDYQCVVTSSQGYLYCEFSLSQLDVLSGEFAVTLYKDKSEQQYTNPKATVSYPLEVVLTDSAQLQVRPQIPDMEDWEETTKKFPGLEKLFINDGSGWPIQNLYRSGRNLKAAINQGEDTLVFVKAKVK